MAEFYSARGWEIPPLPWTNLSPPFSPVTFLDRVGNEVATIGVDAGTTVIFDPVTNNVDIIVDGEPSSLISIDIKPGDNPNSINLKSGGVIPVAILSSLYFDATTVDPVTVILASAMVRLTRRGSPKFSHEDVNGDGLVDLLVHLKTKDLDLKEGDTEAILEGTTFSGVTFQVSDSVRIVRPGLRRRGHR